MDDDETRPAKAVVIETSAGENEQGFESHIKLMTKRDIWNLKNLDPSQLIEGDVFEFLFVWSPLKVKGATGSLGNPIALYFALGKVCRSETKTSGLV